MKTRRTRQAIGVAGALLATTFACTRIIDHSATQCQQDSDCARQFTGRPECKAGVCVPSGLAPADCFFASASTPPINPGDFLNACSTSFLSSGEDSLPGECASPGRPDDPDAGLKDPPATVSAPNSTTVPVPTKYCKDMAPPGGSVLYMSGSSNFKPLLEELAPFIVSEVHLTPIFKVTTSCTGVRSMDPRLPGYATDHRIRDPAAGSNDTYAQYYMGGDPRDCLLGPTGAIVDVGESEIYPETCGVAKNDIDVRESPGPILPIVLVVPRKSHARAISADTARQVFGAGGFAPWNEPARIYIRGAGTATLRLIGLAVGVGPTKFWGIDQGSAEAMAKNLSSVTDQGAAEQAIGMIGSDLYDTYRLSLKALGFRAAAQECAYLPDSSLTTRDKINVRDGHYPLWGRLHFFSAVVAGLPASDAATAFVGLFSSPMVPKPMLDAFITSSFVPDCAMKVTRAAETGTPVKEAPAFSCACYYDSQVSVTKDKVPPDCTPCVESVDCGDVQRRSCNYGFCENIKL